MLRNIGITRTAALATALLLAACPAYATYHFMVIQEVFVGPPDDGVKTNLTPDQRAQYVMLRMTSNGQNLVSGTSIRVEDADGNLLGTFGTFPVNVSKGGTIGCSYPSCPAVIIGTQAAKDLFTFAFDRIVDGEAGRVALPREGGRVCFVKGNEVIDCVAWGNFDCSVSGNCCLTLPTCDSGGGVNTRRMTDTSTNGCDLNYDGPAASTTGLLYGRSLQRNAFNCGTKINSTQFSLQFPRPVNNNNANNNTDTDLDGLIDVLDCAPTNAMLQWRATEIQNLTVSVDGSMFWTEQGAQSGAGVRYDVVKGPLAGLATFSGLSCLSDDSNTASAADPSVTGSFYYLVRAGGLVANCRGTYGSSSTTSRDAAVGAAVGSCP